MYKVKIEKKAVKKLAKIPPPYYNKIKDAILDLADNPKPNGCKKLKGREGYRIRIGDYRVIYEVIDDVLLVSVLDLGSRGGIY